MKSANLTKRALLHLLTSGRIVLVTMAICSVLYPLAILTFAQVITPRTADGSLIRNDRGEIVGSELIGQGFSRPEYFWPRPSAVQYNAAAAGGSNLSPTNPRLRSRAKGIIGKMGIADDNRIPADLVTASGSGLDPHITLKAARYQAGRVATARGLSLDAVLAILEENGKRPGGGLTPEPLVNVLLVNMELDRIGK
jgi:K+-transporting ATPase ATPase C chain